MNKVTTSSSHGFTLIELLIVIVIIGILASIAYPSYVDSVRKSRRAQAQADLVELANYLERVYTQYGTYVPPGGFSLPFMRSPQSGTKQYNILPTYSAHDYMLSATPVSATGQDQDYCGTLYLYASGSRTAHQTDCW